MEKKFLWILGFAGVALMGAFVPRACADREILNVSYDPTRELYDEFNQAFVRDWKEKTGETVRIHQSHGGAGKQARAVLDGLEADVVTLALAYDIDQLAVLGKLLPEDWQMRLPQNSCPYTSTIVFLVRKRNPKSVKDWEDLAKAGVSVITPNPKTSGGARWNFLAAWGYALEKWGGHEEAAKDFVTRIFRNVPVLDTGARGSTTTFVEREIGDVLITWENEAFLALEEIGQGRFELVVPSVSIRAEPPVAVMERFAQKHGTHDLAQAYLEYLYTPAGQEIVARHYYRQILAEVEAKYRNRFAELRQFSIEDFGGWQAAHEKYFAEGGIFDQIYAG